MYNFRYHLITIISIFAALAIGLLLGVAITGSDLVRDASNELADSLSDQFDDLRKTNEELTANLQLKASLSNQLLGDWQQERLKGRTILILAREEAGGTALTRELSGLVTQSGGIPVLARIDPGTGFGLEDEKQLAALQKLLPAIEGEEYATTLARALADEWSTPYKGEEVETQAAFKENYPLTRELVEAKRLRVTVDYQPLLQSLGLQVSAEAVLAFSQRAAYDAAQQQQLPYGVNGIIDTAVYSFSEGEQLLTDAVALQVALRIDAKGRAGDLPAPPVEAQERKAVGEAGADGAAEGAAEGEAEGTAEGEASPPSTEQPASQEGDGTGGQPASQEGDGAGEQSAERTDAETGGQPVWRSGAQAGNASHYALLVQPNVESEALLSALHSSGLSAVISPFDATGRYGVVALLSGAAKGIYGLDHSELNPFPGAP
ncbi:MAG: copper transporter [Coriobacteriales bacterium]|jgi:hypothetical protein|nr:copper transporter [Coriobacteriales bacterium]